MKDKKLWINIGIVFAVLIIMIALFVVFINSAGIWSGIVTILSFIVGLGLGWFLKGRVFFKKKPELLND